MGKNNFPGWLWVGFGAVLLFIVYRKTHSEPLQTIPYMSLIQSSYQRNRQSQNYENMKRNFEIGFKKG